MMKEAVRDNGGGYEIQNVMVKLYSTGAEGAAIDRHAEYNEEEESVTVTNAPGDWMQPSRRMGR